jgi:hypothetical protein
MKVGDLVSHTNFPKMIGLITETTKHSFRGLHTAYSHRVVWFNPNGKTKWKPIDFSQSKLKLLSEA